jgi:hypothetical protein
MSQDSKLYKLISELTAVPNKQEENQLQQGGSQAHSPRRLVTIEV